MPLTRREFLKGLGVAAGGVGLSTAAYRHLIPFIHQPDDIVPGVSTWYATGCRECPAGCSMIVRNRDTHVVKCEGNPLSPINHGSLCARGQSALQGLYDPDRIQGPTRRTPSGAFERVSWDDALTAVGSQLTGKPKIALLSDLQTGSILEIMRSWLSAIGSDGPTIYEPISYEAVKAVSGGLVPSFNIKDSDFLISFAADFLETWISPIEYAAQFAQMRKLKNGARGKFVYAGPRVSMTAANADRRLVAPPDAMEAIARAITSQPGHPIDDVARRYGLDPQELSTTAQELSAAHAVLALPGLDANSARAASIVNQKSRSGLVDAGRPHALTGAASTADMTRLIADMEDGRIDALIISGANPAYSLPKTARFEEARSRVRMVISLSSFMDETTARADWILPSNTPLESWGDYTPYPGVTNLLQPTMGTLFDTREAGDILIALADHSGIKPAGALGASSYYEFLRRQWDLPLKPGETSETLAPAWESLVQEGGRWVDTPSQTRRRVASTLITGPPEPSPSMSVSTATGDEIRLWTYPHIYFYDGRGANRRWLQETPEPVTNGVWGTWAELHPSTAKALNIGMDDIVEISLGGETMQVPAYVWDGVAPNTVAIPMGGGHTSYGRYAEGIGANVLSLASKDSPVIGIRPTGKKRWVTRIKGSSDQHDRDIVQTALMGKSFSRERKIIMPLPSGYGSDDFYPGHPYKKHRWAMTVDLDRCIGCHACVTACYAENNLGLVGAEGIRRRREMAWLRIDRYMEWKDRSAPILFQPMMCQQCDAAPCEPVCPVYASAHNEEGLNMQIYNRCVGTRYCSHNCPYKVRRFNWYDYDWPSPLQYQLNPDVTVRCRGVMEKCTFCIQRIREAEIIARREGRPLIDGEITPACVQTCPTGVFTFGDLMDPDSHVSKIAAEDPRAYQTLAELNTKPAVIYLKRIVDRA